MTQWPPGNQSDTLDIVNHSDPGTLNTHNFLNL